MGACCSPSFLLLQTEASALLLSKSARHEPELQHPTQCLQTGLNMKGLEPHKSKADRE